MCKKLLFGFQWTSTLEVSEEVGVINAEGPPVPIPNTEVKLCRADNTWLATAREDRYTPTQRRRLDEESNLQVVKDVFRHHDKLHIPP